MAKVKANSNGTVTVSGGGKSYTVNQSSLSNSAKSSLGISGSKNSTKSSTNGGGSKSSGNYGPVSSINNGDGTTTYYDAHGAWTLGSKGELLSSSLNPGYSSTLPSNAKISSNSTRNSNGTYSYNKNVAGGMTGMKFGKDVYSSGGKYDLAGRNQQIVDLMKKNGINADSAKSVQDFLEMYSKSYSDADDNDKLNTADKIYKLYNGIPEFETDNDSPTNDVDKFDLDKTLKEEGWDELANQDEEKTIQEPEVKNFEEQYDNSVIQDYEDRIADLQSQIDSLNNKNTTEEKKGLTDEQKTANEEASAAAWNAAQGINNTEAPTADTSTNVQPVVNSENYGNRGEKIMNVLSNLGYKIDNAPSEQAAEAETSNILEGGETEAPADTQAQIAESNATGGEVIPEYTDEVGLVSSYEKAFDDLLAGGTTPENIQKAVETYLQAKDAAALFTVQNNLSDEAYQNMLNKIKGNTSLRTLLQNYNK